MIRSGHEILELMKLRPTSKLIFLINHFTFHSLFHNVLFFPFCLQTLYEILNCKKLGIRSFNGTSTKMLPISIQKNMTLIFQFSQKKKMLFFVVQHSV